jgi:ElaB/YqjD/DUF883 family membrane-anchored ribosome-binding protein
MGSVSLPRNFWALASLLAGDWAEDRDMAESAGSNGKNTADVSDVKDHLRAAGEAAAGAARARADQAREWATDQWSSLQERVEAQPYRATAWALGIGVVAGFLLAGLIRGGRR